MIVPFAAGGSADVIGQRIADGLRSMLGQSLVVDNARRRRLARYRRDREGCARRLHHRHGHGVDAAINPAAYKSLPFDVLSDLVPICNIAAVPNIMSVNPACRQRRWRNSSRWRNRGCPSCYRGSTGTCRRN
jgi:tripartite-type tricarboxylate transporter receptor subunit TctC